MLENSKHLLALCVVCGVIGSYLISVYILLLAFVACVYIFFCDSKLLGQGVSAVREFTFPVPSWIKSIISSLMNSYHLSKPLEPEPNSRRNSPFVPNLPIPRRSSCRSGRFTCLDENTDYGNRRNGIGLCTPSTPFNNSYSNSIHGFRRHSGFNNAENSSKIEEFSTPQTSPWARRQNYSGNDYSNVRRVQTVAGPLLATSGLTKRKSNDIGLYVDANSPGLASRIVQYREEGTSPGGTVWTHQPQYNSPGQFPMVHLNHSPSSLPVLSPLSSQKASRRSVRVKIAPPDPLGSRLYPLSTKSSASYSAIQADHSTKSVIETLKEISRKRIHSQLDDQDDDAVKRQKRNMHTDVLTSQGIDDVEGENGSKRLREESPRQHELSPPTRPAKRIRNNEILSSLSSSRKLLQGGSMKRKTHNLDWSRCSTPVLGKQQKTVDDDDDDDAGYSSSFVRNAPEKSSPSVTPSMLSQALQKENNKKISQMDKRTPSESERSRSNSLSLTRPSNSGKEIQKSKSQVPPVTPKLTQKGPVAPIDDTPWQKDSPFVSVSSPDDVIDDISALEEKREEDRRSRLMSLMTVISGGEPPVKVPTTTEDSNTISSKPTLASTLGFGNNSLTTSISSNNLTSKTSENGLLGSSTLPNSWPSNSTTLIASPNPNNISAVADNSKPALPSVTNSGTLTSPPSFTFGTPSVSVSNASPALTNNISTPMSATPPATSANIAPVFGSSTQINTQQNSSLSSPQIFGSSPSLFGSKPVASTEIVNPFNSQPQVSESLVVPSSDGGNVPLSNASSVSFGVPTTSVPQSSNSATAAVTSTLSATPVLSTSSSTFQLRPAVSGIAQESIVPSSSSGFGSLASTVEVTTSNAQTNVFAKTIAFGTPENPSVSVASGVPLFGTPGNPSVSVASGTNVFGTPENPSVSVASGTTMFGTPATTSSTPSFVFGSTATSTPSSGSQTKPGLFSFGNTSTSNPSSQTVTSTSNVKSVFGSSPGGFGQAPVTSTPSVLAPSQPANSQSTTNKIGGFKFDLSTGKSLFGNQSNVSSGATTNVFGNPTTTVATANSETKPFAFGSSKPLENPFALNTSNNNSTATTSQIQTPGNLFGSNNNSAAISSQVQSPGNLFGSSVQQKQSESDKPKENLFSFGGNSVASPVFSAPQTGGFSAQPASTSANSGFSFSSTTPGGFSQLSSGTDGFSMQANVTSTSSFASPPSTTPAANSAFTFGSSSSKQTSQSNMFAFGASSSTSEPQSGGMFAFGSSNNPTTSAGTGLFGQPAVPVAAIQPQAAQAQPPVQTPVAAAAAPSAFQFGAASSTQQLPGAFSFGSSSNTSAPTSGFSSGGSFQMNSGGFGGGSNMFSIGSGSTAPRVRSARVRRTK